MVAWYLPIKILDTDSPSGQVVRLGPGACPGPRSRRATAFMVARADCCLPSAAVGVVLVPLDVLIDGLPDHVGQITVLSPCDLFQPGSAVRIEPQAVVLSSRHGLRPGPGLLRG